MNSTHPFYTIFIPMTLHAKIFTMFVGGPQGDPELEENGKCDLNSG